MDRPPGELQVANTQLRSNSSTGVDDDSPACQSCRRRKLKCSRDSPTCSQCARLDTLCAYPTIRLKPGMKSGAIEALSRRLQVLEDVVLRGAGQPPPCPVGDEPTPSIYHVSMALAKALQAFSTDPLRAPTERRTSPDATARKRKWQGVDGQHDSQHLTGTALNDDANNDDDDDDDDDDDPVMSLPSQVILQSVIKTYFQSLHHWIPFLHQSHFEIRLSDPTKRRGLTVVLHAMVCSTLKLVDGDSLRMSRADVHRQVKHSRQIVLLTAMSSPSIENLQALVILAFNHIGSGEVAKAWSLIGSLTRTVEYLRLTVEPEEIQRHPLRKPLTLLADVSDWTEIEERRRLFWNIFLLDRFCSITTGWSTSLTSDDVHRRLPCDGGLWAREEMSETPFFGIWNKSAAKIGNSIAFIPAHYPTPDHEDESTRSPGATSNSTVVDTSKLGAFAYCIEATESLSQVTTFFLQQKVDFQNRQEVRSWLTRFKELDLRLVHWKMFLPQKWKDSNISPDLAFIDMDPNLTLAHITHNTSMILLHQHIAYPPPHWNNFVKLPSSCSAETCQLAAVETASMAQKYLKHTQIVILSSQFALCAFIAGRILLVHWRFYETDLSPEFFVIVNSLREMSRRWQGFQHFTDSSKSDQVGTDLANQYANRLESFHATFQNRPGFCLEVLGYSKHISDPSVDGLLPSISNHSLGLRSPVQHSFSPRVQELMQDKRNWRQYPASSRRKSTASVPQAESISPSASNVSFNPSMHGPGSWQNPQMSYANHQNTSNVRAFAESVGEDELTAMSDMLLGQQFLEMDRVITFDSANFALDMSGWQNGHQV